MNAGLWMREAGASASSSPPHLVLLGKKLVAAVLWDHYGFGFDVES
jgi:hypothetical protein